MKKQIREQIRMKYGGLCAYSGTPLKDDWQIDHIVPIIRDPYTKTIRFPNDDLDNMVPCQKIINQYKGSLSLELFRTWYLGGLHVRLKKLPKNPYAKSSIKRKQYLLEIAGLFNITDEKPFSGYFYFETLN